MTEPMDTTDTTLFVRTSGEDLIRWERSRIVEALIREAGVDVGTAEEISRDVEARIVRSGISALTTNLIRELVDACLIERGMEEARRHHTRLGMPLYDVEKLIFHPNRENANIPHGPEGTNLILAEGIKREYALHHVFSREVADAHIMGDIHINGLGAVDRIYSITQSLGYLKKFGLNLPRSLAAAKPAKHAEVLLAHMVRFSALLQGFVVGNIGWRALNVSFAPYLVGMGDREVHQLAQMLVYEFSQLTSGKGGQAMFTDIHLSWEIPPFMAGLPIIGPGGKPAPFPIKAYEREARRFACALLEVYKKGDGRGRPFTFPRPFVHITPGFFGETGHGEFLELVCTVAAERGNPYLVFERDRKSAMSMYGYPFPYEPDDTLAPWTVRYFAVHNVTINLPRLAYRAGGDYGRLIALIDEAVDLAIQAHRQKGYFIERLLSFGEEGPLSVMAMKLDGYPYLRMDRACYLVGLMGLDDMVRIHCGESLHESPAALAFGVRVLERIKGVAGDKGRKANMRVIIDQSHAETTAHRFARLDLRYFSPRSGRIVRGDISSGSVYYNNFTSFSLSAPLPPLDRIRGEGLLHEAIEGEAATIIWLGETHPPPAVLMALVTKAYYETTCKQLVFSPDFTACDTCGHTCRGLKAICPRCGSGNTEGIAMITHYFSRVSGWNKGKRAELRDRFRIDGVA